MGDFRSFGTASRLPAVPMQRIIDPAGWSSESLADTESWSYRLTESDVSDLGRAVERLRERGISAVEISRENFDLGGFGQLLDDVRRELIDGRGMVMLRGFPVERFDRESLAIAYLGLGAHLGRLVSQNSQGHVLGHVKNLGTDYALVRGYDTNAELQFHSDGCDIVGLLCLQPSMSGGTSRVVSSVTIHNRMLDRHRDLVEILTQDFYRSRAEEVDPGAVPWFKQPLFFFEEGYFSAAGPGSSIEKAQRLAGVPPLTEAQKEAVRLYRAMAEECAVDIEFQRGDIQLLNGWVMLHSRRGFQDWPEPERRRHLLRMWLNDPAIRPVPKQLRGGRAGAGVRVTGVGLVMPLDVYAAE